VEEVRELIGRLFGGRRARPARPVCYLRENGPIAYELDLLSSAPRERADAMLASPLTWHWRTHARGWTELTRVSLSAFLSDLPGGDLLMAGTDDDAPGEISDAVVGAWLRRFCRTDSTPVAAIVSVSAGRELLFVQQDAQRSVTDLLGAWAIDKSAAERKSYARLGGASLEAVADRLSGDSARR
jgi:hypothetical protein